jgi:serine/threonine-protein kinase
MPPGEVAGDLTAGTTLLGRYRIDGVLGRGGMGVVYAAHHTFMDQRVALKLLSAQAVASPDAAQRFLNEARNAAKIPGENVCRILDVGLLETGLPYIAMEYLDGRSLDAIAAEQRFVDPKELSHWVLQALLAVAHAHARGIIHRDLKPSNLLLAHRDDGSTVVKVLDFGISKSMSPNQQGLTSTRSFLGSPAYMAPEHIRSPRTVDTRADIWSLGVVLYELSSGAQPYDGSELGELLAAILEREPEPLASRRPEIPPDFCDLVHRCLAKNREWRFQTVAELAAALAPYAGAEGPALAEKVRKALAAGAESRRASLADNSGSLPAVATVTGSGVHSAPSGAAAAAGSVGSASSGSRGDAPAAQAPPAPQAPIVAITGTALTHSAAQRIGGRRSAAWVAGGAGLLCGVGIAMTLVLSARHRMPPPVAPAAIAASTTGTAMPPLPATPAAVAPLPDEPPASGAEAPAPRGESAAPPAPIPPASTAHTPSVASAAAAPATRHPHTPQRPSAKPTGLSTSRD